MDVYIEKSAKLLFGEDSSIANNYYILFYFT